MVQYKKYALLIIDEWLLLGATGIGKTYLACALGMAANRNFYNTKYIRLPDLLVEIAIARGDGTYREYMKKLKKTKLLILDEGLLYPLKESEARNVLELVCEFQSCSHMSPEI